MANPEHLAIFQQGTESWNRWRSVNQRILPDLSNLDFTKGSLRGYNLHSVNFTDSDMQNANLSEMDLSGADFSFVNLTGADLTWSRLSGAWLCRTILNGADFYGAIFEEIQSCSTSFKGIRLGYSSFINTDLSMADDLEEVIHDAPSSVGIDTIYKSEGRIPEIFLRGCGVPEQLIQLIPSLTNSPIDYYSCFISYSHADKAFAHRLYDSLQGRGIRCWLDEHQLLPGDDIYEQVDKGIRMWDKVLLCCSEVSLKSWWVDNEIEKAFKKEQALMKSRGKKVWALIPLNIDGFLFQWENGKADQVRSRLAADFTGWKRSQKKFETQFERVVQALQTGDAAREIPPVSKL